MKVPKVMSYRMYNAYASKYDHMIFDHKYQRDVDFISSLRSKHDLGYDMLDVGCGTGSHIKLLSQKGFRCQGIDINDQMLKVAIEKNPDVPFFSQDMSRLSLGKCFDFVTCLYGAINYLEAETQLRETVKRFFQHLKPSGCLLIDTMFSDNLPEDVDIDRKEDQLIITQWKRKAGPSKSDLMKYSNIIPNKNLFFYEEQYGYFQNPYLIMKIMKEYGFKDLQIFDYSFRKFMRNRDFESIVVGFKK